ESAGMHTVSVLLPAVAVGAIVACTTPAGAGGAPIVATLESRSGSAVQGVVRLQRRRDGIRLRATVTGLPPDSEHGFHIHEHGDCSASDAASAGGHFNPTGAPHGRFGVGAHHAGDLPSLRSNARGIARIDVTLRDVAWDGPQGVVGRSVIVHANPDDFTTQPTGNSGARIACAVLR
ncbi:MAG: superoxide dismutase family protein, partial [Steroidobacteraceae bacterium]|nr:superoxide dismutase family protein [Steroidobacteraceae bacterium]MDW8258309.1 superoxide dismutase family protein [Gammaproteobacteria bacterium]